MSPIDSNIVIALIAGAVALATSAFVFITARLRELNTRVSTVELRERLLWAYCRKLIDHIYKGGGAPPPEPDEQIAHLFPPIVN
ncbi:MAG: hypothetical protein KGL39_23070 [Patescibacteria group bacterium]|nr:hypothetical protein [Patescibacteria group bacterium]